MTIIEGEFEKLWAEWMQEHATLPIDPGLLKVVALGWWVKGFKFAGHTVHRSLQEVLDEIQTPAGSD